MLYPKIQSIFKRDPDTNYKTFLPVYSTEEIEYLDNNLWESTEKIDGTNIRLFINNGFIQEIKGRTSNAQLPKFLIEDIQKLFFNKDLSQYNGMIFFGEGYGRKIQSCGSQYIKEKTSFILFDILCNNVWLKRESIEDISCNIGINCVPFLGNITLSEAVDFVKNGFESSISENKLMAEGLVLKTTTGLLDRQGKRIITKIKTKDFHNGI